MAKNSCNLYPEAPGGGDSRLYKDLLGDRKKLTRTFVNWLYAAYHASNMGDAMDNAGFNRNAQGEHNAKDVLKFINIDSILSDIGDFAKIALQIGATDITGQLIDYADAKDALTRANELNEASNGVNTSKALVATVVKHGDVYNIIMAEKNSKTFYYPVGVRQKLQIWDIYKQAFAGIGIDIENMPQEVKETFSAYNDSLVQRLQNLSRMQIDYMYKNDAMILFNMDPSSAEVRRLVNSFGSIEAAAQALDDINHGSSSYTNGQKTLLDRAVMKCQQFQGLDLNALQNQVAQINTQIVSSPEEDIKATLHKLNKKFKIDINEFHRDKKRIDTLSEAAADAAFVLKRKIRQLERERGNNAEGKRLETVLSQLDKELANKRYYSGIMSFLSEAASDVYNIDTMLQGIPQTGTDLSKAFDTAKILQDIKTLRDQYYSLVSALADKNIIIDESIGQTDIDNIRNSAKDIKDYFDKYEKAVTILTENTMIDIMRHIMGNTAPDGQVISNVIKLAAADSSLFDWLYSVGKASNPVIAAMGSILRGAEDERDGIMNAISLRIRRYTDKLYKKGHNSEFMYEDDGHIISDIDWNRYKEARKTKIKSLYRQGFRGFDLKQAIEDWEDVNTEDRVVDPSNGRTERVPNYQYRKNNGLVWNDTTNKMEFHNNDYTQAQQDYYNEMMQLKGEIGTLLPAYAQHQYLPPQIRRKMLDAMTHAKNAGDVYTAVKNKVENLWTIREDDTNYNMNGIIDGDEYLVTEGAFDNTELKQIPIFFVNKVAQGELLKNFSTGMAALAGTAVNYEAMSSIAQVVEFIGDFVKGQDARSDKKKAEIIEDKEIRIFKDLIKKSKNENTSKLVDGFIEQHIYGRHQVETGMWSKIWSNIIGYTSFKGLATNIKGAFSNYLVGEFQMMIEAGAGEFYGFKDFAWAHYKLFDGTYGEFAELLTNNMSHKAPLLRELFDPLNENFTDKSNKKYYKSMFRQLLSHDCSFIGYASGEFLIHYVNMYAILNNQKVFKNGKEISLYDAYSVKNKQDGNSELVLDPGVTIGKKVNGKWVDTGQAVTEEWVQQIRNKIKYANHSTHGAMNSEDKGIIHQYWMGRGVMNFRQWMVEHYSRRFRKRHFDASLGMEREGYWVSFWKMLRSDEAVEKWNNAGSDKKERVEAIQMFIKDFATFAFRAQSQWDNLDEMQRHNVKRVISEMTMYIALMGLSFALGESDKHKKEFWRRWWIYQVKRLILDTEASMPQPKAISSFLTILQSPMAGVNTLNSLLYCLYGIFNGDIHTDLKSGPHKGENKYWRNVRKYNLPGFKDWEQMQKFDTDESIFQVFKDTPTNR